MEKILTIVKKDKECKITCSSTSSRSFWVKIILFLCKNRVYGWLNCIWDPKFLEICDCMEIG